MEVYMKMVNKFIILNKLLQGGTLRTVQVYEVKKNMTTGTNTVSS